MKNTNDILERILLNMKYDSKKTLNENKVELEKYLILEEQQIPTTMNQIMQFQSWIWKNVDKLGDPDKAIKDKKYNTSLCDTPCTPYNRRINGKIYSGAIDGIYGGNTKKLWGVYKEKYKKANPTWSADDIKTREKVLGKTIPTTKQETKNFQKWFLEEKEKAEKDILTQLYKTKLCDKPCIYNEAVDGIYGGNTKKLWDDFSDEYKKANKLWSVPIAWDKKTQDAQEIIGLKIELAPFLRFSKDNPSGWNFVDKIPKAFENVSKLAKINEKDCPFYWGWDLLNETFPYPVPYTKEQIDKVKKITKPEQEKLDQLRNKMDVEAKEIQLMDLAGDGPTPSDQLGRTRYRPDTQGIGPTKSETEWRGHNEKWEKILSDNANHLLDAIEGWNIQLAAVKEAVPKRCKRPMKFCDSQNKSNCVYISYSDVCKNAGGLWVYNVGTSNESCLCRSMFASEFNYSETSGVMTEFNGPKGAFVSTIRFQHSMAYQTEWTGELDTKQRQESHHTNFIVEMGLMAAGIIATISGVGAPLAPLFFGAATIAGVKDGIEYINEGETHMGVTMISLSLLGAGEVGQAIKLAKGEAAAAKFMAKAGGKEGFETFMKTAIKNPELLTAADKLLFNELKAATYSARSILGKEISKKVTKTVLTELPKEAAKWSFKEVFKFITKAATVQPSFKTMVIYILGVPYTIDQIYLALYGNDIDRQSSPIGLLYSWLYDTQYLKDFTGSGSLNAKINEQKLKQIQSEVLLKFTQNLQENLQEAELEKLMKETIGKSISAANLMTDQEAIEYARKNGQIEAAGFDVNKFNEILKKQEQETARIENLEGCNLLDSIKTLSSGSNAKYQEYTDKIKFVKDKINSDKKEDFINGKCNGVEFFWKRITSKPENQTDFMKQVQRDTRTIVDNPDYQQQNESYDNKLKMIIKNHLKKYIK